VLETEFRTELSKPPRRLSFLQADMFAETVCIGSRL